MKDIAVVLVQCSNGVSDSLYSALITQNLHNGIQVGGVTLAGNGEADEGGHIRHSAGESSGISLIGLHIGGEANVIGDCLDLVEPGVGIIVDIEPRQETLQYIDNRGPVKLFVKDGVFQILGIEEAHIILGILPASQIITGFIAAAANGKDIGSLLCVCSQLFT